MKIPTNFIAVVSTVALLALTSQKVGATEATWEYAIQLTAKVQSAPAKVTLSWPQATGETPNSVTVYRKSLQATNWGNGTLLPGNATFYTDTAVTNGSAYEYQVVKSLPSFMSSGYICVGLQAPAVENRGKLVLVVDNTYVAALANELQRLQQDLVGDGWTVLRHDVARNDTVVSVKNLIKADYAADPANVKAVFLFGHVPVPYSGNLVPDGHYPDHQGAWPADPYYGDMDGNWTDTWVNNTSATEGRNRNVPGDGKFDQSEIPSAVELEVGRVDLANLPGRKSWRGPATFPNELKLLRNYLDKDHAFRHKQFTAPPRALIYDDFGIRGGEAFAASAYRNFAPLVGTENMVTLTNQGQWIPVLQANNYLWAYGCGAGSYTSIGGLGSTSRYNDGTTTELVESDIKAVFTLVMGSWLGDWDSEDNIMRSILAARTETLVSAWSGRPHWFCQHMALGQNIGYCARLTQNNGKNGLYSTAANSAAGQIHIALMGDPTLRMHPVAPASTLSVTSASPGLRLDWAASQDDVEGYYVYRASSAAGPFTRLSSSLVQGTSFTDTSVTPGTYTYMVRAMKLQQTPSGSYHNLSQGITANVTAENPAAAPEMARAAALIHTVADSVKLEPTNPNRPLAADVTPWVDDALPAGAVALVDGDDGWIWTSSTPAPFSGTRSHQSSLKAGRHEHFFNWAWNTLPVTPGDYLFAYIYLDPAHPPTEVMLQWTDGSWEHRAYWGANKIDAGRNDTSSRRYMGPLPTAGKWVRLEVPASQVGLEGRSVKGMSFALYDGRATWDMAGKSSQPGAPVTPPVSGTNIVSSPTGRADTLPGTSVPVSVTDDVNLQMPRVGNSTLHILSPTVLELILITTKQPDPARVSAWDLVDSNLQFHAPSGSDLNVLVNGEAVGIKGIGFRRRPFYAPLVVRDLRIENALIIQLANPIAAGQRVEVKNPAANLWPSSKTFAATAEAMRYSPAIHVNQEGYVPGFPKKAMVGYYLGNLGEMPINAAAGCKLVNNDNGATVWQGALKARRDVGWTYSPAPYQQVYEADFSSFTTPGEYRLLVPGLGASLPFLIEDGIAMGFARAYALGLYHQRCGTKNEMPFTRHVHGPCHVEKAEVPSSDASFDWTWNCIAGKSADYASNPRHTAPQLKDEASQLYPFINKGPLDVSGGHHDAGDYSKYTINVTRLIHYLMFAVDAFPGVADLDNLGLPESGDGVSDLMQEAKWEADFLAKLQDADGGFYFLVYPKTREYESNVTPDQGDSQVVWPKNTAVTAAAVAALAQCASSPKFKSQYPQEAERYMQKARLGWKFLTDAIARYGKDGAYQKITHYGNEFMHDDELAWAACEMFLATGDESYHQALKSWFDPASPDTWRWGWWRLAESYGQAIRSYAFAVRSGRLSAGQLDADYLAKCEQQIVLCAQENVDRSHKNAYGSSFPIENKPYKAAGWYFSSERAFDITVAYQLDQRPAFLEAVVANMNYEGGCNPANASYITGMGWKRQREIVHQYAQNDRRVLPPSGLPLGNIQDGFSYINTYKTELGALTFPQDGAETAPYPFYDRWADTFNVSTEFVVTDQARSLASLAFLAARTWLKSEAWKPVAGQIVVPADGPINKPRTARFQADGFDLSGARIVWEARDQEPAYGPTYTFTPANFGKQWIEAEAQWPDGRRIFAVTETFANNNLPTVSIEATSRNASETEQTPGVVTFTRTGNTDKALTVKLNFSGTATKWEDYKRPEGDMPDSVIIPAGAASATLTVIPVADKVDEGTETATLTIAADPAYNLGQNQSATLTIKD